MDREEEKEKEGVLEEKLWLYNEDEKMLMNRRRRR